MHIQQYSTAKFFAQAKSANFTNELLYPQHDHHLKPKHGLLICAFGRREFIPPMKHFILLKIHDLIKRKTLQILLFFADRYLFRYSLRKKKPNAMLVIFMKQSENDLRQWRICKFSIPDFPFKFEQYKTYLAFDNLEKKRTKRFPEQQFSSY